MEYALGFVGICVGGYFFIKYNKMQLENERNKETAKSTKERVIQLECENKQINELNKTIAKLEANVDEREKAIQELEQKLQEKFKNISTDIIQKQSETFDKQQKQSLNIILEPLQKEIENVKKQMKEVDNNNYKLTEATTNFTNIFKGSSKTQGQFGEWELENILNMMGLNEGIDYEKEKSENTDNGKYRPDYVIHLTNDKNLIIDVKFSYENYEKYCITNEEKCLSDYYNNVKSQIDDISRKNYENLAKSYEFIIVFLPLEGAYLDLVKYSQKENKDIIKYAMDKNIAIVTKSSLLSVLKMIIGLRNVEKQNKNITKIIELAQGIYEKIADFTKNMTDIEKNLQSAQKAYNNAVGVISTGHGNALKKAQDMMNLVGKKNIKKNLLFEFDGKDDALELEMEMETEVK
ncbi:MAG: DNA recombination protein RmuC [Rickettsiales bacterium]|jgi:DNA recombination protein RmuC|nr:DNA recombination protein RmuC [Rickettsiales bacterium]